MKTRLELYKSYVNKKGRKPQSGWRWRICDARNGKIICASTETYKRRVDAVRNLDRVVNTGFAIDYSGSGEINEVVVLGGTLSQVKE